MAASDDALATFYQYSLHLDPVSKQIFSSDKSIHDAISSLNALHTSFKSLDTPSPPPPVPVNPKRSANIAKLRDSANAANRKGQFAEAIRLWNFTIEMAASRPSWEPVGLIREELALLYLARCNSNIGAQNWVDGWKDAECSKECKRGLQTTPDGQKVPGNPKAYLLGAKCLLELGRWYEAGEWLEQGLEVEGTDGEDCAQMAKMLELVRKEELKNSTRRLNN